MKRRRIRKKLYRRDTEKAEKSLFGKKEEITPRRHRVSREEGFWEEKRFTGISCTVRETVCVRSDHLIPES